MPDLEQLTLAKELPSIIAEENKLCFDRVPLVRLQCITLEVTIQTAAYLFARLVLPDDTRISLNLTEIQGCQSFSDLFSAMYKGPGKYTLSFRSLGASYSLHGFVVHFSKSTRYRPSYSWGHCCDDIQFGFNSTGTYHSHLSSLTYVGWSHRANFTAFLCQP
ncbi:hypothetical protein M405DRAFT_221973 [Rhizopogon salebrosus TDB-379]|nr:hypothetical protein M405DRAFT_221973 [Rhizopogon salebrosus TDB-379]